MEDGADGVKLKVDRGLQRRVGVDGGSAEKPCAERVLAEEGVEVVDDGPGITDDLGVDDLNTVKVGGRLLYRLRGAAGGGGQSQGRDGGDELHDEKKIKNF